MSIVCWLVLGVVCGLVAARIFGRTGEGPIMEVMVGVSGALVAGAAFSHFAPADVLAGFEISSMVAAGIGAVAILLLYHLTLRRRAG